MLRSSHTMHASLLIGLSSGRFSPIDVIYERAKGWKDATNNDSGDFLEEVRFFFAHKLLRLTEGDIIISY